MLDEHFPIIAGPERPAAPLRVLKHGDCFGVFDHHGNIVPGDASEEGVYHDGTRFLSWFELLLFGHRPLLLSSTVGIDDAVFDADLTNPDVMRDGHIALARGEVNVHRSRILWDACCIERIRVTNFRLNRIEVPLAIRFDADFADVFEVRGTRRARKGERLPDVNGDEYVMRYRGIDERERRSRVRWSRPPDKVDNGRAVFLLRLDPKETATIVLSVAYETDAQPPASGPVLKAFDHALKQTRARRAAQNASCCRVLSSSPMFNRWLDRSTADLQIMLTDTPHGSYPYAGIPWFSTPFGRDGLITAFELLWVNPAIARGVLTFLAEMQATSRNDEQDAQPGKILHEMRGGEMAALGEVPFGRYYGSCDATPLFVMLAHAYYQRTGDRAFIDGIWPNIVAALEWMQTSGDSDQDGFIDYSRRTDAGLINQGWKDSHDSIFHDDGTSAEGPIALCEVQGYAYGAWHGAAQLAALRGDVRAVDEWSARADRLRERFELEFWCEGLDTYALALDGRRRPCRVRTSNPGHCLFSGIVTPERAKRVCDTLMADASFNGWGVPDGCRQRAPIQPAVLSQRLDLAARQRAGRRRRLAVWIYQRGHPDSERDARVERGRRSASTPRADLRLHSPRSRADTLSGCLCAAGLGRRGRLSHARRVARRADRRASAPDLVFTGPAARVDRVDPLDRPGGRRRARRSADRAPPPRPRRHHHSPRR